MKELLEFLVQVIKQDEGLDTDEQLLQTEIEGK